jgi:hypothetical protein
MIGPDNKKKKESRLPVNSQLYAATHIKGIEEDCVASECWELSLCGHWLAHTRERSSVLYGPSLMAPAQRTGSRYDNNIFLSSPD